MSTVLAKRRHVRDDVSALLLERIVAGQLPPDRSVGEEEIAAELGVSRTPLREALISLERDGFVNAQHGRGFVVTPLSDREVREVYPIMWGLEVTAIELAANGDGWNLPRLRELNQQFILAESPRERMSIDIAWHMELIGASNNQRLLALAHQSKNTIRRYELAYMSAPDNPPTSAREHAAIIEALDSSDFEAATNVLKAHWRQGMQRLQQMFMPSASERGGVRSRRTKGS